jgi:hypothetical protein
MTAVIKFVCILSVVEAIWSPRVYDYTISVAPEVCVPPGKLLTPFTIKFVGQGSDVCPVGSGSNIRS